MTHTPIADLNTPCADMVARDKLAGEYSQHLAAWLRRQREEDQIELFLAIVDYLATDPEAINRGLTWQQMAERGVSA